MKRSTGRLIGDDVIDFIVIGHYDDILLSNFFTLFCCSVTPLKGLYNVVN